MDDVEPNTLFVGGKTCRDGLDAPDLVCEAVWVVRSVRPLFDGNVLGPQTEDGVLVCLVVVGAGELPVD